MNATKTIPYGTRCRWIVVLTAEPQWTHFIGHGTKQDVFSPDRVMARRFGTEEEAEGEVLLIAARDPDKIGKLMILPYETFL
jgi:hypothetical protein